MKTTTIKNGSREVIISEGSKVSARLYVSGTATLQSWTGKTLEGAKKWAAKAVAS